MRAMPRAVTVIQGPLEFCPLCEHTLAVGLLAVVANGGFT